MGIVFHGTTAIADLPHNYVVAQTLVEALNNSTNTPNLSINPASVKVLGKLTHHNESSFLICEFIIWLVLTYPF